MIYLQKFSEELLNHSIQQSAARELLLYALFLEYGYDRLPEITSDLQGKPFFADHPEIHFNYSHTRTAAAVGLSTRSIGVDVEALRSISAAVTRRICHAEEAAFLESIADEQRRQILLTKLWTAKEACGKCTGLGLRTDLRENSLVEALETGRMRLADMELTLTESEGLYLAVCEAVS
ncbi:MAG: 4'-phosphopantetheinyl transferase superfamily protein [Eubacteriales bacterium]|nr:4'-phosphopantetheinyl transferase superfamily protein [Eubacteriales bacterium]